MYIFRILLASEIAGLFSQQFLQLNMMNDLGFRQVDGHPKVKEIETDSQCIFWKTRVSMYSERVQS